jgi:hypothetical protein
MGPGPNLFYVVSTSAKMYFTEVMPNITYMAFFHLAMVL